MDDEEAVLSNGKQLLEASQVTVFTATSAVDVFGLLNSFQFDVALVDWRLKGSEDGIRLGKTLLKEHGIPFVLISGFLSTDITVQALRLGAADVVDKPLRTGRVLTAIEFAIGHRPTAVNSLYSVEGPSEFDSISQRWARLVLQACQVEKDPRTEAAVAKAAGASPSSYREICNLCRVGAKDTRDLVRFLRALLLSKGDSSTLDSHLSVFDSRTRARLFERAGLPVDSGFVPLRTFIMRQTFVPVTKECLHALTHRAANDPVFLFDFRNDEPQAKSGSR